MAQKLALRHMSPLAVQAAAMYVYSVYGPMIFVYARATGDPISWNVPGVAWTLLACTMGLTAGTLFLGVVRDTYVHTAVGLVAFYPCVAFVLG